MSLSSRRTVVVTATAVVAVAATVALALFQPWRLVTDTVVDEALPSAAPVSTSPSAAPTASAERPRSPARSSATSGATTPAATATTSPTTSPAGPQRLTRGSFVTHEHDTTGTASIVRLPDGSRILRLEGLETSDGPDLKVWLSTAPVVEGRAGWHVFDDGRYQNLGKLKGNRGNQNYALPADLDLAAFRSISIWCDRFNVSFGAAPLTKV